MEDNEALYSEGRLCLLRNFGAKAEAMCPSRKTLMWSRVGKGGPAGPGTATILHIDQCGEGTAALIDCRVAAAQDT